MKVSTRKVVREKTFVYGGSFRAEIRPNHLNDELRAHITFLLDEETNYHSEGVGKDPITALENALEAAENRIKLIQQCCIEAEKEISDYKAEGEK